jgi:hypothetical protein
MSDTDTDVLGPVDYLVVEFPADRDPDGSALPHLDDLVRRGVIRVLDLAFVVNDPEQGVIGVDVADFGLTGTPDVTLFSEASTGLLGKDDLIDAGSVLEPGCSAAVLVYENRWAVPFVAALRRNGAELVANGRIPEGALVESLADLP